VPELRRVLARSRALCACAVAAAAISGCTAGSGGSVTVSGKTLTIYQSVPPGADAQTQDILAAEQLAFRQSGGRIAGFKVELRRVAGQKLSDNARAAIEDTTAVAYVGEVAPGTSADSIGITNNVDLLELSPTDTDLSLTQSTPAVTDSPNAYYEAFGTYGHTFARVVPTTALEAKALQDEMSAQGVSKLYVSNDGTNYGKAIALRLKTRLPAGITLAAAPASADAVFYGASSVAAAARFFNSVAASHSSLKLFGPSAIDADGLVSALSPGLRNLYVSSPGFLNKDLPAGAQQQFVAPFTAAYHHAPAPEAIFGYEAMSALLAVLRQAGSSAGNRSTVVHDFLAIKNRQSVLGTYSMNANGDTSIAPFVLSRLRGGRLVPYKFVPQQG
jgi:branched-chain amino acid transport system substrate-binding protein